MSQIIMPIATMKSPSTLREDHNLIVQLMQLPHVDIGISLVRDTALTESIV